MIRHIFMCTINDDVPDELVEQKMAEMHVWFLSCKYTDFYTLKRR